MEAEECSSSESGWTMYLASPMHDGGDGDIEVQANDEEADDANDHNSNESDDGSEDSKEISSGNTEVAVHHQRRKSKGPPQDPGGELR